MHGSAVKSIWTVWRLGKFCSHVTLPVSCQFHVALKIFKDGDTSCEGRNPVSIFNFFSFGRDFAISGPAQQLIPSLLNKCLEISQGLAKLRLSRSGIFTLHVPVKIEEQDSTSKSILAGSGFNSIMLCKELCRNKYETNARNIQGLLISYIFDKYWLCRSALSYLCGGMFNSTLAVQTPVDHQFHNYID